MTMSTTKEPPILPRAPPRRSEATSPQSRLCKTTHFLFSFAAFIFVFLWATRYDNHVLDLDLLNPWRDVCTGSQPQDPSQQQPAKDKANCMIRWSDVTPSAELEWIPCFREWGGLFLCARLTVPMDYHRPLTDGGGEPTVEVALIMLPGQGRGGYLWGDDTISPANFSVSPMLVNPGGPGGSGVDLVRRMGGNLQAVVGRERDVIGFDPRGIGESTPKADCFLQAAAPPPTPRGGDDNGGEEDTVEEKDLLIQNNAFLRRMMWEMGAHEVGLVNSSDVALAKVDARHRAVNRLCDVKDKEEGDRDIFRYVGTPNVARDMLSIVHAWDKWQGFGEGAEEGDAQGNGETQEGEEDGHDHDHRDLDTRGKLVYWGFSYGTLLGATFAAMFPDKVGRLIIDGVLDADHYVQPTWYDSLIDTDYIWSTFFTYCHAAGPHCIFSHPSYTALDLRARYERIITDMTANPIIVITPDKLPVLITASDVRSIIFRSLYQPTAMFPAIASLLLMLESRAITPINAIKLNIPGLCLPEPVLATYPDDGMRGVMCSDKRYPLNDTISILEQRFQRMGSYSQFADIWMTYMLMCSHFEIPVSDPPMRWGGTKPDPLLSASLLPSQDDEEDRGEFDITSLFGGSSSDWQDAKDKKIKTSFPILMMTNTYDPVTPKSAGLKMARKFEHARLLEQKAEGHCTLSASSACTLMTVRRYMSEGILPPKPDIENGEWVVCEAETWPWGPRGGASEEGEEAYDNDDGDNDEVDAQVKAEMFESWAALQKEWTRGFLGTAYGENKPSKGVEALLGLLV